MAVALFGFLAVAVALASAQQRTWRLNVYFGSALAIMGGGHIFSILRFYRGFAVGYFFFFFLWEWLCSALSFFFFFFFFFLFHFLFSCSGSAQLCIAASPSVSHPLRAVCRGFS
jgi:hypothetical protein